MRRARFNFSPMQNKQLRKNCKKLNSGHWMSLNLKNKNKHIQQYWNVHDFYKKEENTSNPCDPKFF